MSPNWLFRFWTIGLIASQRLWRIMDWSSKLWASGKHLSLLSLWQQNIQRRNLSKNARRNLVEVPDFWNDDDTDEDDNWVDVHMCATKQPYLKIMIIGWWWGPFHNLISYPPQTQMATACFRLKFLLRPPPSTPSLCPIKELICSSGDDCSMTLYTS